MVRNNDLHIVEPFEVQTEATIVTRTYSTELTTQSKTTSPIRVTDTDLPIVVEAVEEQNKRDLPIVVEAVEAQNKGDLPIVAQAIEAQNKRDLPIVMESIEAKTIIDPPIVVEPVEAKTIIIDPPTVVEPVEAKNIVENQICLIHYGAEFQGLVIRD